MESKQILREMKERGFEQTLLALALGKSPSLISKVIHRKAKSYSVALAIAKLIELPISQVFPEYQSQSDDDRALTFQRMLTLLKKE